MRERRARRSGEGCPSGSARPRAEGRPPCIWAAEKRAKQQKAPPCRCAADKTPSYATRWVASRAFTLPSSILRWEVCNPAAELRLPNKKCWIISYGADAHSRVTPAAGSLVGISAVQASVLSALYQLYSIICGERLYSSSSSSRKSYSSLSLSRKISATRSNSSSS